MLKILTQVKQEEDFELMIDLGLKEFHKAHENNYYQDGSSNILVYKDL